LDNQHVRVVIVDSDLSEGRRSAAQIEQLLPDADVLLYAESDAGLSGIVEHTPDVVLVGPRVARAAGAAEGPQLDGPQFLAGATAVSDRPKYVGMVTAPDADWSVRYVDAGAKLVVGRPLSRLDARAALRHAGAGIP
jgi:DNA-binding NarL/FixJ family response regulator